MYDVTQDIHSGSNTLAADVLRYESGGNPHTPFRATLYLKLADGKSITFKTAQAGRALGKRVNPRGLEILQNPLWSLSSSKK